MSGPGPDPKAPSRQDANTRPHSVRCGTGCRDDNGLDETGAVYLRVGTPEGLVATSSHSEVGRAHARYVMVARHSASMEGSPKAGPQTWRRKTMFWTVLNKTGDSGGWWWCVCVCVCGIVHWRNVYGGVGEMTGGYVPPQTLSGWMTGLRLTKLGNSGITQP